MTRRDTETSLNETHPANPQIKNKVWKLDSICPLKSRDISSKVFNSLGLDALFSDKPLRVSLQGSFLFSF